MKEKLLKLAELALNKLEFYSLDTSKLIRDSEPHIKVHNDNITYEPYYRVTVISDLKDVWKLRETKEFNYIRDNYEYIIKTQQSHDILINFEDQPPLRIWINGQYDYTDVRECPLGYQKHWWGMSKKERETKVKVDLIKPNHRFKITSGSISEFITKDEYESLYAMYVNNKEEFIKQNDINKINKRIDLYSK